MKTLSLVLGLASLLAFACDKHQAQDSSQKQPIAASTSSPSPVKVVADAPAKPAEGEAQSCGNAEMAGGECSGGCDQWDQAAAEVGKRPVPADASWSTIAVSGMTCGGCERRIIANLGKLEGVMAVEADAELGQVRVATARGSDLRGAAVERINSLGYAAK